MLRYQAGNWNASSSWRYSHLEAEREKGEYILVFQRAWTIPIRSSLPSCCCASPGPLIAAISVDALFGVGLFW